MTVPHDVRARYQSGIGIALGDPILTASSLQTAGIFYLDNSKANASDTASYRGLSPELPFATLAQAVADLTTQANSYPGPTLVVGAGHRESIASKITITKRMHIVGAGNPATEDRAQFTPAVSSGTVFEVQAGGCQFRNVIFKEPLNDLGAIGGNPYLFYATTMGYGAGIAFVRCKFYVNGNYSDDYMFEDSGADGGWVWDSCEIVSTETDPTRAFYGVCTVDGCMRNTIIDYGSIKISRGRIDDDVYNELFYPGVSWGVELKNGAELAPYEPMQISVSDGGYVWADDSSIGFTKGLREMGHQLISAAGFYVAPNEPPIYVHSGTGTDGAGHGFSRDQPLASLAYALSTYGSSGQSFVLLENHEENIGTAITLDDGTVIIGCGLGDNRPKLTRSADIVMFHGNGVFVNMRFGASTVATTNERFDVDDVSGAFYGCRFEFGANDNGEGIYLQAGASRQGSNCQIHDCTFVSVSTTTPPGPALRVAGGASITGTWVRNCVFDGGAVGWDAGYLGGVDYTFAIIHDGDGGIYEDITLLRNSPAYFGGLPYADLITITEASEASYGES